MRDIGLFLASCVSYLANLLSRWGGVRGGANGLKVGVRPYVFILVGV